ncbi:MAG TPA: hypothetical protein VME46_23645, partial [Acidimicrobiales bacterium]|nr:hypothetical protein [Acidimicrobiales bacterium]
FADYISKPHALSGINFGDGPTAIVFALAVLALVMYLAVARPDIQPGGAGETVRSQAASSVGPHAIEPGLETE